MPEADGSKVEKSFYTDVPQKSELFFLKGSNSYDWGMKNRLARIFDARSGKTVMLVWNGRISPYCRSRPTPMRSC
jgi:putative autoinducer-2 (AI-2) aldolase